MAKKRRKYACEVFASKRDASAEAAIIRSIGHKATVKAAGGKFKVCRTYRKR